MRRTVLLLLLACAHKAPTTGDGNPTTCERGLAADCTAQGDKLVVSDRAAAHALWEKGCSGGDQAACVRLGVAAAYGWEPDEERGLRYLRAACDKGYGPACLEAMGLDEDGHGLEARASGKNLGEHAIQGLQVRGCRRRSERFDAGGQSRMSAELGDALLQIGDRAPQALELELRHDMEPLVHLPGERRRSLQVVGNRQGGQRNNGDRRTAQCDAMR